MTYREKRLKATLRHWRNFGAGMLLGTAVQTPVFAATDFIPDDWSQRILHGDPTALLTVGGIVVILAIVVALGFRSRGHGPKAPPLPENAIGRHRPFHG